MHKNVLAFDFGASSGRAMLGSLVDGKITLKEVHRFSNDPVMLNGTFYWDTLRLFHEIKQGIIKAKQIGDFESIGINTWGVDFGLLDKKGKLIENPINYRDKRTEGILPKAFKKFNKEMFYELTGNQFMEINTAFQLFSLAEDRPEILEKTETLLMTPDLFNYFLTGVKSTEYSIASTTQLLDARKREWCLSIINALGIPKKIFTPIVKSGTVIGNVSDEICDELGINPCPVISVASHDTASAVVAVPAKEKDFIFISCGTWSLFGTELNYPIINKKSSAFNITNEGGFNDTTRFLKNIIGLWLIQESKRQWEREGLNYTYADLEELALQCQPLLSFIDPDDPMFVAPGNIPRRVQEFCVRTNQIIPKTTGEIMRCIYQSLAFKYKYTYEQLKQCTDKNYTSIHFVGGGTKDKLLCQMTANACNMTVNAGPIEATVLGNIAVQLITLGEIKNISKARKIISSSQSINTYEPINPDIWQHKYSEFLKIINK